MWISTCICLLALVACTQPEQPWLGKPAPDERIRLGIRNPDARFLSESFFEIGDTTAGSSSLTPYLTTEYKLDENGHLTELRKLRKERVQETTTYGYNTHGQLISSEVRGPQGEFQGCIVTTYCADGQLSEIQSFNAQRRLRRRTCYTYDDAQRLLHVQEFSYSRDQDGAQKRVIESKEYRYWDDGQHSEIKTTLDGQWKSTETYLYGRLHETILAHSYKRLHDYDLQGLLRRMETRDSTGKISEKSEYNYDEMGRTVLENHFWGNGAFVSSVRTIYDAQGNVVRKEEKSKTEASWESEIEIHEFIYAYDSLNAFGDWQVKTCSRDGQVTHRVKRDFGTAAPSAD